MSASPSRRAARPERRLLRALLLIIGLVAVSACGADPVNVDVARSVLALDIEACGRDLTGRATAVVIGPTTAVTVAHPFAGSGAVTMLDSSGAEWAGDLRLIDPEIDLAVIELAQRHPAPLGLGDVEAGDRGIIVGYGDRSPGDPPRVLDYQVLRRVNVTLDGVGERGAMELAAAIRSGDSGGVVVDGRGRLGGVVFAAATNGDRGWAIDRSEVDAALRRASRSAAGERLTDLTCGR